MDNKQLQGLLQLQYHAIRILQSIQNTCDLNLKHTGSRTMKISETVLNQIDQILLTSKNLQNQQNT